ncbi:site-2 protease family protein [Clostridium botulinum C]|uniref:Site-2 protease family protein n=3 Tax=Clostridium botulinum TaxID=1491 RepID=A0A9Q4XW72_CLOBO|nr:MULTISPECIES: site-2 protease family protein [Clostridium]AYF54287.1 site-2 protease family protein [Clostridium novyi]EES92147.1 sterol-regulatory element binding protein [Clostridium botulinum D str. 1873]KEI07290.1 peptidase [Clostridium sp. K25]MBO3441636.1 site-2 protease family protein [Clostridium haemolyticum]MCD3195848.1 site-2 protease family protein [Clostridium botulinum C]
MFSTQQLLNTILVIPAILLGFTFHEYAHALVAYKLGDNTPKVQGRLTLNPLAHIDIIGFLMILFFKFGWAKPVQTNPNSFKNYYKDDLKVSLAGVVGNIFVATVASIILGIFLALSLNQTLSMEIILTMLVYTVQINALLVILNLLPLPGFDGFHILKDLFPKFFYKISDSLYRYQFLILFLFIIPIPGVGRSIIGFILSEPTAILSKLFMKITSLIAGM